jgi:hypothetical protein
MLSKHHITYIILAKEDDSDSYNYLDSQTGVKKVTENDNLKLYKVAP